MKNTELAQIVERVWKDEKVFEELYLATFEIVYKLTYMMMENQTDTEDVIQEIYVKIHRNLSTLQDSIAFNTWMKKIVMNTCRNALRDKGKVKKQFSIETIDEVKMEPFTEEENISFLPEEWVDQEETKALITQLIQELPEKLKQTVLLYYFEEMKAEEIAEVLECKYEAVYNRLHYARESLKKKIIELQEKDDIQLFNNALFPFVFILSSYYVEGKVHEVNKKTIYQKVNSRMNSSLNKVNHGRHRIYKPVQFVVQVIQNHLIFTTVFVVAVIISCIVYFNFNEKEISVSNDLKFEIMEFESKEIENFKQLQRNIMYRMLLLNQDKEQSILYFTPTIFSSLFNQKDGQRIYSYIFESQQHPFETSNILMDELLEQYSFELIREQYEDSKTYKIYKLVSRKTILYIGVEIEHSEMKKRYVFEHSTLKEETTITDCSQWFNQHIIIK